MWKQYVLTGAVALRIVGADPVWAQERPADPPATTFEQLSAVVKTGQALEVIQDDGTRVRGTLTGLQDRAMTLTVKGASRTFQESSVRSVRRTDSVGNGVANGALAALEVASTRGTSDAFYGYAYVGSWLFPAIGAVVGWAVDHHVGHGMVFEPARAQAFRLAPNVAAHHVGVSGAFSF